MVVRELLARLGLEVDTASFEKGTTLLGALDKGFLGLSASVAVAAGGLFEMVKATATAGDHIDELSQSTGVNAQTLQELGYAAGFSSVSLEEMSVALGHLAKGGAKDVKKAFFDLADKFAKMPDGGEKTKIALDKLGRAGAALIPVLNEGSQGLKVFADDANAFGVVLDKNAIKQGAAFNDALDRLGKTFVGLRNRVVGGFLKPLTNTVNELQSFVLGFQKANPAFMKFITSAEGVKGILAALEVGFSALAIASGLAAFETVAAWVVAAAPFIAMGAAIMLVYVILEDFVMYLGNDGETAIGHFVDYFNKEFASPGSFKDSIFAWFTEGVDHVIDKIREISPIAGGFFDLLTGKGGRALSDAGKAALGGQYPGQIGTYNSPGVINGTQQYPGQVGNGTFGPYAPGGATPSLPYAPAAPWGDFKTTVNVHATPGMDEQALATKTARAIEESNKAMLREASRGTK